MKIGIKTHIVIAFLLSIFACQPHKIVPYGPEPPLYGINEMGFAPDFVRAYVPNLGEGSQERRFPFGSNGLLSNSLRLVEVRHNYGHGEHKMTFQYDSLGRLSKRISYSQGFIFIQYTYEYKGEKGVEVLKKENREASGVSYGVSLRNNDLVAGSLSHYEPISAPKSLFSKIVESKLGQEPETKRLKLGFDNSGNLVQEEELYRNGVDEILRASKIYKRDQIGNISFSRPGGSNFWGVEFFTYDNKPNPFRTTGDITLLQDLAGEISNVTNFNNVLRQTILKKEGPTENILYEYEYRPDGYPSKVKAYRSGELQYTREFVYNQ